ncbi:MAG TPA: type II secretion system F family protein [Solirubrobacteraceae bacterium]|jgi:tight adherence protein B|nr:type II secretion system F family protein [Solirubrobacteraceae bacterium]
MSMALAAASNAPFWSTTLALALVVAVCSLLVGLTVAVALLRRSSRGSVRERIGEFVSPPSEPRDADIAAEPAAGILARTERSLERGRWWDEFKEKLDIARIERPAIEVVYLTAAYTLAAAVLATILTKTPVAGVAALVLVPVMARAVVNRRLRRQRILFGDQLPAHLQELAAAMRAGHSMVSGITVMADGASEPAQGEFQRVLADEQLGMPLEDALRSVALRMDARDMEQVALVAELHRQTGGNMAEVLDRVAEAVRERAELNRELRTLTAQARGSRWIVTSIPPTLLVVIDLLNPRYLAPLFDTETGHLLLALAVGLILTGSLVLGRIVRIEA